MIRYFVCSKRKICGQEKYAPKILCLSVIFAQLPDVIVNVVPSSYSSPFTYLTGVDDTGLVCQTRRHMMVSGDKDDDDNSRWHG